MIVEKTIKSFKPQVLNSKFAQFKLSLIDAIKLTLIIKKDKPKSTLETSIKSDNYTNSSAKRMLDFF